MPRALNEADMPRVAALEVACKAGCRSADSNMSKIENREAAYDALKLAKSKLEAGDTDGAQRFALKSIGLYETAEAQQFQKEIQEIQN